METNKTRMANCKYSWPFRLMMEVTNEVIGQWKWVMISQRLIKHTLIIVTMNRKVKEDSKEMSEKKPSDISTWIFMPPKIAFSRAFLWIFEWLFNGFFTRFSASFFCRYFADFDMKNEEIWQLLRKSEDDVTCWINGLVMRDRKRYNMCLNSHLK